GACVSTWRCNASASSVFRGRKRWFACADHLKSWEAGGELTLEFLGHAVGASVEEVANAAIDGDFADIQHEVQTVHPTHLAMTLEPAHPNHRHAVRSAQEGLVQDRPKLFILLGLHDAVHTRYTNVAAVLLLDPARIRLSL